MLLLQGRRGALFLMSEGALFLMREGPRGALFLMRDSRGWQGGAEEEAPAGEKKKLGRVPNMKLNNKGEL